MGILQLVVYKVFKGVQTSVQKLTPKGFFVQESSYDFKA